MEEQYEEIILGLDYPGSQALLAALRQVANKAVQETQAKYRKVIMKALDATTLGETENILYSALFKGE